MHSDCVVVLGPYRSGTSLVSQILHALGVDFGPLTEMRPPPNRQNPGGYFQRPDVVSLNVDLIHAAGGTQGLPCTPEQTAEAAKPNQFAGLRLGSPPKSAWRGIKDPRFSITLQAWVRHRVLDAGSLRIVSITRRTQDVVNSVLAHDAVRQLCGSDLERARTMVERYSSGAAWHVTQLGVPALDVHYEDLVRNPEREVRRIASFLSIEDEGRISRAIELVGKRGALLRHYRHKLTSPRELTDTVWRTLLTALKRR